MNDLNHWEQQLHNCLAEHEAPLPADGWARLEKSLSVTSCGTKSARKRRYAIWGWGGVSTVAACALAVLVFPFQGFFSKSQLLEEKTGVLADAMGEDIRGEEPMLAAASESSAVTNGQFRVIPSGAPRVVAAAVRERSPRSLGARKKEAEELENVRESQKSEDVADVFLQSDVKNSAGVSLASPKRVESKRTFFEKEAIRKDGREMTLALAVEGGASPSVSQKGYVFQPVSGLQNKPDGIQMRPDEEKYSSILIQNTPDKVTSRISHKRPLRFTLMAGFPLSRSLSLESGLGYTYLQSEITSGSTSNYFVTTQRLHYIGVPLQLRYTFLSASRFSFYAAGGGRFDVCLGGNQSTTYVLANRTDDASDRKYRVGKGLWQGSLNLAAGAHYSFLPDFGFFVEPGLTYYFSDSSSLPASRHAHPLGFSLQAGLRWNIKKGTRQ